MNKACELCRFSLYCLSGDADIIYCLSCCRYLLVDKGSRKIVGRAPSDCPNIEKRERSFCSDCHSTARNNVLTKHKTREEAEKHGELWARPEKLYQWLNKEENK